jgi:ComF family protein
MVDSVLDWALSGGRCTLCHASAFDAGLCAACIDALPWNALACPRCGLPLNAPASDCRQCRSLGPVADTVLCPLRYAPPVDRWVHALKYEADLTAGRRLGRLLAQAIRHDGAPLPEWILPMPLHPRRLRSRGYNQATEIARWLARSLAVPMAPELARRWRETADQTHLDAAARRRNLRDAFRADAARVSGRQVAVVDDVLTTGASARALVAALRRAGATRVSVWCVARTPLP